MPGKIQGYALCNILKPWEELKFTIYSPWTVGSPFETLQYTGRVRISLPVRTDGEGSNVGHLLVVATTRGSFVQHITANHLG